MGRVKVAGKVGVKSVICKGEAVDKIVDALQKTDNLLKELDYIENLVSMAYDGVLTCHEGILNNDDIAIINGHRSSASGLLGLKFWFNNFLNVVYSNISIPINDAIKALSVSEEEEKDDDK
jgi:hypothetical protein